MKKLLAALLATAMAASMATLSFAADKGGKDGVCSMDSNPIYYFEDENTYAWNSGTFNYGDSVYFVLRDKVGNAVSDSEMIKGMKIKTEYEMGEDLVESAGIVKKQIGDKYFYFVEMKLIEKLTTADADVIATITLNKSKKGDAKDDAGNALDYKVKDLETDIAFNVGYIYNYSNGVFPEEIESDALNYPLWPNEYFLLKYNYDEEFELEFGTDPNEGIFTVDVSGQGKTLIYFNTDLDEAISAANPDADIIALNFNGVRFNRIGEFVYEAEGMNYAYAIRGGELVLLGEFDGEEVTFNTRELGRYVFSDIELTSPGEIGEMTFERDFKNIVPQR